MIRFVLICIVVFVFLVLSIPLLLIEWIIGKISPRARDISSLRIIQGVFRFILFIAGTRVTEIGKENIPKDQPVLYIGNHRSYFDILLIYSRCPDLTGFVAKKEMDRYPVLNIWMRLLYCLFLDRKDLRQGLATILEAIKRVKAGISICIFPEGTRNTNESELDLLPFHDGSFKIATKSGCPIIPVCMTHTQDIFEAHLPKIKPAHVVMEYCPPIFPDQLSGEDKKHISAYTEKIMLETLKRNEALG